MDIDTIEQLECAAAALIKENDPGVIDDAIELYRQAVLGREGLMGHENPQTLQATNNLAKLLHQHGSLDDAAGLYRKVLAGRERIQGVDHPGTSATANILAAILFQQGSLDEAHILFERALSGRSRSLGPEHPDSLSTMHNLATLLAAKGRIAEAVSFFKRALSGFEVSVGPNHPMTVSARKQLVECQKYATQKSASTDSIHPDNIASSGDTLRDRSIRIATPKDLDCTSISCTTSPAAGSEKPPEQLQQKGKFSVGVTTDNDAEDQMLYLLPVTKTGNDDLVYPTISRSASNDAPPPPSPSPAAAAAAVTTPPLAIAIEDGGKFEKRGVHISLFKAVRRELLKINSDPSYWSIDRLASFYVGNHEILKDSCRWGKIPPETTITYSAKCSLIEVLKRQYYDTSHESLGLSYQKAVSPSQATIFISFAYKDNFIELVDALETFLANSTEFRRKSTWFWFDLFVNDQWTALEKPFEWWQTTFREAVQQIGITICFVSPWNSPTLFTRAWCLYEISCSKKLILVISEHQSTLFQTTLSHDQENIVTTLTKIRLENATSFLAEDRERIFDVVRAMEGGFSRFNELVVAQLRDWITESSWATIRSKSELDESTVATISPNAALKSLLDVAKMSDEFGLMNEAGALYDCILTAQETTATQVLDLLFSIKNRALAVHARGKASEAVPLYRQALAGLESVIGPNNVDVLQCMTALVHALIEIGRQQESDQIGFEEAKVLLEKALPLQEGILGPDHWETLNTVTLMADVLKQQGKFGEALPLFLQVMLSHERERGPDHLHTLTSVQNMAAVLQMMGRFEEAVSMFQRTLSGLRRVVGPDHEHTIICASNLSSCMIEMSESSQRFTTQNPMLQVQQRRSDSNIEPDEIVDQLIQAATIVANQGNRDRRALVMFQQAFPILNRTRGPEHPSTLNCVHRMASLLSDQGKFNEALPLFRQALSGYNSVLGSYNSETLSVTNNFAAMLANQGNCEEALTLFSKARLGFERLYGHDHPKTLDCNNNVAMILSQTGRLQEAMPLHKKSLDAFGRLYDDHHPKMLHCLNNSSATLFMSGNFEEALPIFQRLAVARERVFGPAHKETLHSKHFVSECRSEMLGRSKTSSRFSIQLSQLKDFGFLDENLNLRALSTAQGNIEVAIEILISSQSSI